MSLDVRPEVPFLAQGLRRSYPPGLASQIPTDPGRVAGSWLFRRGEQPEAFQSSDALSTAAARQPACHVIRQRFQKMSPAAQAFLLLVEGLGYLQQRIHLVANPRRRGPAHRERVSLQAAGMESRSMMKSSRTRASIRERTKQSSASSGVQTMGSPRMLKDVLRRIGQPVRPAKRARRAAKRGLDSGIDRLQASRAVDVSDSRQIEGGGDLAGLQHEGRGMVDHEMLSAPARENGRGEGAEALAHLDERVDAVAHLPVARVGQDRPRAERPRPELHAALEPADDLARHQSVDRLLQQRLDLPR